MKKLLLSIAAAAAVVSCTVIDNLKGLPTAEADSYARALEHVARSNIKSIYHFSEL